MRVFILFIGITIFLKINAQEHFVQLNKNAFTKGETISINCHLNSFEQDSIHFATVYLFIENIETKEKWQYRYPLINGTTESELTVGETLKNGSYAFTFVPRRSFFNLSGAIEDGDDKEFTYTMLLPEQKEMVKTFKTDQNGHFELQGLLFADTSIFSFSPAFTDTKNAYQVNLVTNLDSAFHSSLIQTTLIHIGNEKQDVSKFDDYHFEMEKFIPNHADGIKKRKTEKQIIGSTSNSKTVYSEITQNITQKQYVERTINGTVTGNVQNADGSIVTKLRPDLERLQTNIPTVTKRTYSSSPIIIVHPIESNRFRIFGYTPVEMLWK